MSEEMKKTTCPECGAEVEIKEEKKDFKKILDAIRGVLEDEDIDDVDTVETDSNAEEALETSPDATAKRGDLSLRGRFKYIFGNRLINRLIVFLLAVAMLAMTFVPFVTYQVKTADNTVYTVEYSGTDTVQVSLFSFFVGNTAGTPDMSAYEQALNQITDVDAQASLIRQMMLASSVNSRMGFQTTTLVATLLFVIYALFCTIFVIVSAVNLITEFFTGKKTRDRVKRCASDTILCLLICMLPVLCFAMIQACEICTGIGILDFLTPVSGAKLSWSAILSLVLALLGGVLICASHSLGLLRVDKHYFDRRRIKHILALVLVLVVMVSTLMPCLQMQMIDIQSGKEITTDVSLWDIREITVKEWQSYRSSDTRIDQAYVSSLGALPELPNLAGETFMHTMLIPSNAGMIVFYLYSFIEIVTLLMLAFAGVWLFGVLRRGFFGKTRRFMINLFRILTLVCVCVNFVLVLLVKSMMDMNLQGILLYIIRIGVGQGMLVMFLCALLGVVLRLREKRPIRYADEEYDNAEVSYAPYVIEDKKSKKKHKETKEEKRERKEKEKEEKKEKKAQAKQNKEENKSEKDNKSEEAADAEVTETVEAVETVETTEEANA